jgi:hypothetical protein
MQNARPEICDAAFTSDAVIRVWCVSIRDASWTILLVTPSECALFDEPHCRRSAPRVVTKPTAEARPSALEGLSVFAAARHDFPCGRGDVRGLTETRDVGVPLAMTACPRLVRPCRHGPSTFRTRIASAVLPDSIDSVASSMERRRFRSGRDRGSGDGRHHKRS